MGQAKRRGTYEERKARAIEARAQEKVAPRYRPAQKHVDLLSIMAAFMPPNVVLKRDRWF